MTSSLIQLSRTTVVLASFALGFAGTCTTASAQQLPADQKAAAQKAPAKSTKSAAPTKSDSGSSDAPRSTEAQLRQRVEQLEEQLVDLQVVIGTLESLAKTTGSGSAAPAGRGGNQTFAAPDSGRLDSMEMQIKALTAQIEQMAEQSRDSRRTVAASTPPRTSAPAAAPPPSTGFGATTIVPPDAPQQRPPAVEQQPIPARATTGDAPMGDGGGNPKQLYETAYGYLLQQNYGAAESSFSDFLQRYPNDGLAGNAQYWLGESHFVRGNFKGAANAFLKGYQTYGKSAKAPDSLLKLAMSLDRLGQKEAACTSFNELNSRFPQAPAHVKTRADSERRRLGCG